MLASRPEIQEVLLSADTDDIGGSFYFFFRGWASQPVNVGASATDIKAVLEG